MDVSNLCKTQCTQLQFNLSIMNGLMDKTGVVGMGRSLALFGNKYKSNGVIVFSKTIHIFFDIVWSTDSVEAKRVDNNKLLFVKYVFIY